MDKKRAAKAVDWAEKYLGFSPKLLADQKEQWVLKATEYSPEDWKTGILSMYSTEKCDFRPMLGKVLSYMPLKKGESRPDPFMGWEEDPNKTSLENYNSYLEFKENKKRQ